MSVLRGVAAAAMLAVCAVPAKAADFVVPAQYRAAPHAEAPAAPERERPIDGKGKESSKEAKERTPPPRPIVPPEGQQQNPALREECAWLGQRIESLLFRDDPLTANDFMPFYLRFGCPEEHLTAAFGCVVRSGNTDSNALADRIAVCWADPAHQPTGVGEAPADKSPADKSPADKAGGDKAAGDKPALDKPSDRNSSEKGAGDKHPAEKSTGEKGAGGERPAAEVPPPPTMKPPEAGPK